VEAAIDDFQVFAGPLATDGAPVSASKVARLTLHPSVPNPFVASTTIRFSLPAPADVDLRVFDVGGRLVRTLLQGSFEAGAHAIDWNLTNTRGNRLPMGVYLCQLKGKGVNLTRKILLLE